MFFLGHSHIGALFQGGEAHGRIIDSLNLWAFGRPVIYGEDGHRLEPSLEALLGTTVVSAVGGSAHDMVGLVQHPRAFDFVLPEAPDLPVIPGAEIIPHAAVARTVRAMVEDEQLDLIRLLPAPGRRALHLESPPPVEDDAKLGREMGYLGFVPADAHQPSPAWLRYKLWRVHSALVREVCAGCGMASLRRRARRTYDRVRPPPVLIGHSHSQPIFDAAKTAGVRLEGFNFWWAPQPAVDAGRTALHPDIARALSRGTVFSVVGGAAHNVMGLVLHPRPYDFVLPAAPDLPLDTQVELIPARAVREALAESVQEYLDLIGLVRAAATGRMHQLQAPPPLEDGARILPDVPWAMLPHQDRAVSPAPLRYKLWRLYCEIEAEFCGRSGVEVIAPPTEAVDARGYLKPAYYADAMHANQSYGALVLQQMRRAL